MFTKMPMHARQVPASGIQPARYGTGGWRSTGLSRTHMLTRELRWEPRDYPAAWWRSEAASTCQGCFNKSWRSGPPLADLITEGQQRLQVP